MDLQGLQIFVEVAETKSFTRAGENLGYSQPTVSFQIKQLEKELGFPLFDRIGRTVSLTQAGAQVLTYAQEICHKAKEMTLIGHAPQSPEGTVRIGMADSLCMPLVTEGFSTFRQQFPKVRLTVFTAGTRELFRMLDHNEVDLVCTLDDHIYDTDYVIAREETVGVHFVASPENPLAAKKQISAAELAAQPFLLTEEGMSYRRLFDEWLAQRSLEVHPVLEMSSADQLGELVAQDLGVSLLPDYVTEQAVSAGRLVRLHVTGCPIRLWKQLLYRKDKWISAAMDAVIRYLIEHL